MKFQEDRDARILWFIYNCGGVVAVTQLWRREWKGRTLRAVQRRVQKLCAAGYLARPTPRQYRVHPIPEAIVWLGWRGILYLAGQMGVSAAEPKDPAVPNQLEELGKALRRQGVRWEAQPRFNKLAHDLRIVDFRLALDEASQGLPFLQFEEWLDESVFRSDPDVVRYDVQGPDGSNMEAKRGVIPDAFFVIVDERRRRQGLFPFAKHLLEVDMATHSSPYFGEQKVLPYAAYIRSDAYEKRFGSKSGRWLVITTGRKRMWHLLKQTATAAGKYASSFYFTTFADIEDSNVLADPVWWQPSSDGEPVALFDHPE